MFNDDDEFAYEERSRKSAKDVEDDRKPRFLPKEDDGFGGAGPVAAPSSSRARMLAQQRELQLKKRESAAAGGGMVRSSQDGVDSLRRSAENQFTPAVRQFSAPKAVKDMSADAIEGQSEFSKSARNQPIKMVPIKMIREDRSQAQGKPARPPRSAGRAAPDDRGRKPSYEEDEEDVHYDHRGPARGPGSRYRDDNDEDEDGDSYNDSNNRRKRGNGGWGDEEDRRGGRKEKERIDKDKERRRQRHDFDDEVEDEWESEDKPLHRVPSHMASREVDREPAFELDLSDMKAFLTKPLPKNAGTVQCQIRRNRDGTNKLHPTYTLYLKQGEVFLMNAKKRPNNRTSNYLISMGENDLNREGPNYIGKLRSNFIGTEFQIFDNGHNPKDEPDMPGQRIRKEMGGVMYAANVLGSKGPRKMQVALPPVDEEGSIVHSSGGDNDLLQRIKDHECFRDTVYLINKPPRWNDQVGAYVLNFQGRVTMASVKNFQLVDPDAQDTVVLQFGRVGKEDFTMDMHYPITPFQAFAVTLSSFDSKIACD